MTDMLKMVYPHETPFCGEYKYDLQEATNRGSLIFLTVCFPSTFRLIMIELNMIQSNSQQSSVEQIRRVFGDN